MKKQKGNKAEIKNHSTYQELSTDDQRIPLALAVGVVKVILSLYLSKRCSLSVSQF